MAKPIEMFSSVKNARSFILCFMGSFRRPLAVVAWAGALLWRSVHRCLGWRTVVAWAGALLRGLPHRCLGRGVLQRVPVRCCSSQCGRRRLCFWLFSGRFVVLGAVTRVASCADRLRRNRMTESSRTFEIVGDGEGQRLVAAGRRKTTGCHRLSEGGYLPVAAESDEGRPTCSESAAGSSWCSSLSARSFSALKT